MIRGSTASAYVMSSLISNVNGVHKVCDTYTHVMANMEDDILKTMRSQRRYRFKLVAALSHTI